MLIVTTKNGPIIMAGVTLKNARIIISIMDTQIDPTTKLVITIAMTTKGTGMIITAIGVPGKNGKHTLKNIRNFIKVDIIIRKMPI